MANIDRATRAPRTNETREKDIRQVSWKPAHDLPTPAPHDGYDFRWVRVSMLGSADPNNMAKSRREGWEPCKSEDHPEMVADFAAFGLATTGIIEIGGLVLCRTTSENTDARKAYYENLTHRQAEAVDNSFMRENDPRMPLFKESRTKVSFGRGS